MARKTRRSPARRRPGADAAPSIEIVQPAPATTGGGSGGATLLERATQEILAVTYWFDPLPQAEPYPVTVRFTGRRADVKGRVTSRDRFVQDEKIERVIPGSGPISLTARVHNVNPGEWEVTAQVLASAQPARKPVQQENAGHTHTVRLARLWRRWAPPAEAVNRIRTRPTPFVRVPGILPGIWGTMATLGVVVAFVCQFLLITIDHLALGPWWAVTLGGTAIGIAGAKVWFIVQYRSEHRIEGWCIQGFIFGATVTAAILLALLHVPAGQFLDVTAPGLLFAMAVGRLGCFFAGCCYGPPTASRWSVWSSDQHVGARRVPTQLMELSLALILGIVALVAFQLHGSAGGAYFVGGLAAYTLGRQGILHLRAEPRKTKFGLPLTAALAALVFAAAIVYIVRF